ncbi:hypothetical protein BdWA1_001559 [Babesia duncani]|uniref:Uncharacterized protein n=1 Tax=Babesia duncani TaxID=323732 RepID=A0AAD9UNY7_9APIC|nr:hypothetical protein BdWA1_001559 [Babesia duncani]
MYKNNEQQQPQTPITWGTWGNKLKSRISKKNRINHKKSILNFCTFHKLDVYIQLGQKSQWHKHVVTLTLHKGKISLFTCMALLGAFSGHLECGIPYKIN